MARLGVWVERRKEEILLSPRVNLWNVSSLLLPNPCVDYFANNMILYLCDILMKSILLMGHLFCLPSNFAGSNSWWSYEGKISSCQNFWLFFKKFKSTSFSKHIFATSCITYYYPFPHLNLLTPSFPLLPMLVEWKDKKFFFKN